MVAAAMVVVVVAWWCRLASAADYQVWAVDWTVKVTTLSHPTVRSYRRAGLPPRRPPSPLLPVPENWLAPEAALTVPSDVSLLVDSSRC